MRFNKLKIVSISVLIAAASPAFASGGGGEAAEGAKPAGPMNKTEKEFNEKTSKLNTVSNRIVESEKHFAELVHHKELAKDPATKQKIIQEMLEVAKQRNKDAEEYNKLKSDLTLRYPSQGDHIERRYQTQSKRSIEEMEGVAGLDELLTRVKKVVEKKFAPFAQAEEKVEKKASAQVTEDEKPKRLKLEK